MNQATVSMTLQALCVLGVGIAVILFWALLNTQTSHLDSSNKLGTDTREIIARLDKLIEIQEATYGCLLVILVLYTGYAIVDGATFVQKHFASTRASD
jgi:hypothetical protein